MATPTGLPFIHSEQKYRLAEPFSAIIRIGGFLLGARREMGDKCSRCD
jgi:hypothetical protein